MARSGPISLNRVKPRKTWWKTHDISIWNSPDPAWGARALRRRVVTLSDVTGGRSPVRQPISPQPARERAGYSLAVPGRRTCNMGVTKYMSRPSLGRVCRGYHKRFFLQSNYITPLDQLAEIAHCNQKVLSSNPISNGGR